MNSSVRWPRDADGDVLRRMESKGFDFSIPVSIDFNVDFEAWPPDPEALTLLRVKFARVTEKPPEDADLSGYVLIEIEAKVTYEFVVATQNELTTLLESFGGECNSWGVFWEPARAGA